MATFDASAIVGKTLFANTSVELKRRPEDSGEVIYTVAPGETVGVVDSYINPTQGRNRNLYWQFSDGNRYFYAEHVVGRFNLKKLESQGAVSLEDQQAAQDLANETLTDKIGRWLGYAGIGFLAYLFIKNQK